MDARLWIFLSDVVVNKSLTLQALAVVEIASVEDDRIFQPRLQLLKIWSSKFIPFRQDSQTIRATRRVVRIVVQFDLIRENATRFIFRDGIIGVNSRAGSEQSIDQRHRRSFSHIVRLGFE